MNQEHNSLTMTAVFFTHGPLSELDADAASPARISTTGGLRYSEKISKNDHKSNEW